MMFEEDSNVVLISSKPNGKARSHSREASASDHQLLYLSDNQQDEDDAFEETTVFSDSLYGDSLPSMRAQLAATQMKNKKREAREAGLESSKNEKTSLLGSSDSGDSIATMLDRSFKKDKEVDTQGQYKSMGGSAVAPLSRKKARKELIKKNLNISKVVGLTIILVACIIMFSVNQEHEEEIQFITISKDNPRDIHYYFEDEATDVNKWRFVSVLIYGPLLDSPYNSRENEPCENYVFMCGIPSNGEPKFHHDLCAIEQQDNCHSFKLAEGYNGSHAHENFTKITKTLEMEWDFLNITSDDQQDQLNSTLQTYTIHFVTDNTYEYGIQFQATITGEKLEANYQVVIAAIILVWVYVLIGFDIVHRTMAAFIGSTCTLSVLSMIDKRPTLEKVVEWIDLDTICLLFGMMILVGIFSKTGFFDYFAVKAYKLARGKIWPLITLLCLFSAVVSAFLDNVTTILLLTPVSIRLCQVLNLDPRPVLIAEVVFSNIGGTATAIGDPPNIIIVSNSLIRSAGINFPEFTLHLFLGILLCMVAAYGFLSLIYWLSPYLPISFIRVKNKDPPHIAELKREIAIWERIARRLNMVSLEERTVRDAILSKAMDVRNQLSQERGVTVDSSKDMWQKNLAELESKYRITNWRLLIKSTVVLAVVIFMFFMSHVLPKVEIDLGWIAIFGAIVLLILADVQDLEEILHKIEWGTLLFFAGLFVLMEGLEELGLIGYIGERMVDVIKNVPKDNQRMVAIILILWVSAIASSFIDNIPFTTATIPVIWELANSPDLCLDLRPLVWALAFGACLGGNGTLIGASANVVCAGIAEQNGYKISFASFFKIGFPMMIVTTLAAMVYLLLCHEVGKWDITRDCAV